MEGQPDIYKRLNHLTLVILTGFLLVAGSLVFWSVIRAPALLLREDNPRLVEAELRIQRGAIVDRNGVVLAETMGDDNDLIRNYPIADIGHAVGYYSFRHGTAGVEDGYDAVLRGDSDQFGAEYVRQSLHQPQVGQNIQLALDSKLQETAVSLLNEQTGAIILLDNLTGEVMVMASAPHYDPNLLDDQFDLLIEDETSPLLNRAVQGQYQPGLVLQPFIIAWAVENDHIQLNDIVDEAAAEVIVDQKILTCLTPPPVPTTWLDVLVHRCPAPMLDLANQIGKAGLDSAFADFGFADNPSLPLDTELLPYVPIVDPLMAGIGQDTQIITPIQLALAWSALARDGQAPLPWLITAVNEDDLWQPIPPEEDDPITAVSAQTAQAIRTQLSEFGVPVLSGPDGATNSWYFGFSSEQNPRYTAVVVLENQDGVDNAKMIGQTLLNEVAN